MDYLSFMNYDTIDKLEQIPIKEYSDKLPYAELGVYRAKTTNGIDIQVSSQDDRVDVLLTTIRCNYHYSFINDFEWSGRDTDLLEDYYQKTNLT